MGRVIFFSIINLNYTNKYFTTEQNFISYDLSNNISLIIKKKFQLNFWIYSNKSPNCNKIKII